MVPSDVSARPCRILPIVLAFLLGLTAFAQPPAPKTQVSLLDGKTHAATELKIAGNVVSGGELPAGVSLDDVRLIVTPADKSLPLPNEAPYIIELVGGGSVKARQVKI